MKLPGHFTSQLKLLRRTAITKEMIVQSWAEHFDRMDNDPAYYAWVNGGEIGQKPDRLISDISS